MPATPVSHWIGFHLALLILLTFEFAFSRYGLIALPPEPRARRQYKNALAATALWLSASFAFAFFVFRTSGSLHATQFLAGYALEQALSVDNLFVFLLLFRIFGIPTAFQPRVLFWGVLGAILMRGSFIAVGLGLLERFHWVSYLFAVILLIASIRLLIPEKDSDEPGEPQRPFWIHWINRIHPVSLRTDRFFTTQDGTRMVTMLFLALIAIETADIIFALDSIPAVLSITRVPFLAYTSNILAVIGLRSLFFLLTHALKQLRFLHFGLAAVLAFAAIKMLTTSIYEVGPIASLIVIVSILGLTITLSLLFRPVSKSPA